ncbi:MAG: DNA polymerase III subunit beta [Syntrophorhabdus sp.]|nr:DNA polymerase III subunit beta [Syntrophorhabdus sp.]
MKIILDKNTILQPISKIVSITEKRSLMPILSNILIDFGKERTTVYSTDLEVSAITHIDFVTDMERKIVVHGRKFLEILKELDHGEIEFVFEDNVMTIRQKMTEISLSLQDPEEFPETKEISAGEEFTIPGSILLEMIDKVEFAVSIDETRYILTGMFMKGQEGKVVVVGTDGFRMALYQRDVDGLKSFQGMTIPRRSVSEVERMIGEDEDVRIVIDEKHVQFSTEKMRIISRIIEGNFPDYENVLPSGNTNIAEVEREALFKGLKRVSSIIGRSEPVKMTFSGNMMTIEAESDIGRAREVVDVVYDGEETTMNFNVKFLTDVVTHLTGDAVTIAAPKAYGAVLFRSGDVEGYKNIVMPIRI